MKGTATYCAWMAPPDLTGDEARVAAVHIRDPDRPDTAWNPRARRLLQGGTLLELIPKISNHPALDLLALIARDLLALIARDLRGSMSRGIREAQDF